MARVFFGEVPEARDSGLVGRVWRGLRCRHPWRRSRKLAGRGVFHEYSVESFFAART